MHINELIIGLLGGGTLVQLVNLLINARTSRRQQQAQALDSEISALEHTLKVISDNIDLETRRHSLERRELEEEISALKQRVAELNEIVESLQADNSRLRSRLASLES